MVSKESFLQETAFVTLLSVTDTDDKKFTVEIFSRTAEDAYLKEKAKDKLFESNNKVKVVEIIGTYKRCTLKVVGE